MVNLPNFIFSLVMGFLMSLTITLVTTFARIRAAENFFSAWLEVWSVAYPVAVVCIWIYKPFSTKLTDLLLKKLRQASH